MFAFDDAARPLAVASLNVAVPGSPIAAATVLLLSGRFSVADASGVLLFAAVLAVMSMTRFVCEATSRNAVAL